MIFSLFFKKKTIFYPSFLFSSPFLLFLLSDLGFTQTTIKFYIFIFHLRLLIVYHTLQLSQNWLRITWFSNIRSNGCRIQTSSD